MAATLAALGALLLVTPFDPANFNSVADSCLAKSFFGNYGGRTGTPKSVFLPDSACLDTWVVDTLSPSASIVQIPHGMQQLVWIEEKSVEASLKSDESDFDILLERLANGGSTYPSSSEQDVLNVPKLSLGYEVLHRTHSSALLSVSREAASVIDTMLPRFWKSTLLPSSPVTFQPVPPSAVDYVKYLLSTVKFDPTVASIVNNIVSAISYPSSA